MRETRTSGSTSGKWKRSMVGYSGTGRPKGPAPAKANLNHRATSRLYLTAKVAEFLRRVDDRFPPFSPRGALRKSVRANRGGRRFGRRESRETGG